MKPIKAWHFLRDDGTTRGNTKPKPGGTETVKGELKMCAVGLHGSIRALDALQYAEGCIVRRVVLSGEMLEQPDKLCAGRRRELWRLPGATVEKVLREFARWCAIGAVIGHWPDAPEVVQEYLATGKEELRDAAWDAAWAAAWADARAAARAAARATARAAACDAAWADARAAACDAAWADARAAACDAAWAAAWDAANTKLEEMLEAAHKRQRRGRKGE